jgi:flagellar protein FliS
MTTEERLRQQKQVEEDNENSAVTAYKRNNLHIESKIKLVEALYEGVLNFNSNFIKAIEDGDIEKKVYWANRSTSIIIELMNALDLDADGTVGDYLNRLYTHQLDQLYSANRDNNIEKIKSVNKVIMGLLEAWREANGLSK